MQNKNRTKRNAGFTLVEMLIVVAIIAILVAVSIPLVSSSLENSRDATDMANERAAKAEAIMVYLEAATPLNYNGVAYKDGEPALSSGGKWGWNTGFYLYNAETGRLHRCDSDRYGEGATASMSRVRLVHENGQVKLLENGSTDQYNHAIGNLPSNGWVYKADITAYGQCTGGDGCSQQYQESEQHGSLGHEDCVIVVHIKEGGEIDLGWIEVKWST